MTLPKAHINKTFKNKVQIFPVFKKNIWFLNLIPKANFITITAIGDNVKIKDVRDIIYNSPNLRYYLPVKKFDIKCSCTPHMPRTFAKNAYSDRFLLVGDAYVCRYMKNGIESAFQTARLAADTVINHGTHKKAIKKHYIKRVKKLYSFDNIFGRILYFMNRLLYINTTYTEAHMIELVKEQIKKENPIFTNVFCSIFTGDRTYRAIFKDAIRPALIYKIMYNFLVLSVKRLFLGEEALRLPLRKLYKLVNLSTIAIVGGGPAGTACAIRLAKLAKLKGLTLHIYLFEGRNAAKHHKQCVGILSPPLLQTYQNELGVTLPPSLIKSEVPGYELHSDKTNIFLTNYRHESSKTYSVRRSELDEHLLKAAKKEGVKIIQSRVTNIEFCTDQYTDEVRIFSESIYLKADAVVCAFGLDEDMLSVLERATEKKNRPYKKPKEMMETFITRLDFPKKIIDKKYDKRIYAFLPSGIKNVEFGAITIKDDHIVANVAGHRINSLSLYKFLNIKKVNRILPSIYKESINLYYGRFPSKPAKNLFGDRYITVGDSTGWLRPLKGKGINLAVTTGIKAADTMFHHGISQKDFEIYKKSCRQFVTDFKYGSIVRTGLSFLVKTGLITPMIKLAKRSKRLNRFMYDSVSAESTYKNIFKTLLTPFS
jgi:flavin-dependent dehydrogenase